MARHLRRGWAVRGSRSPGRRWDAKFPLERATERGLGFVAGSEPDLCDGLMRAPQPLCSKAQSLSAEIAHGRLAHDAREPVRKGGAREPNLIRKFINAPGMPSTRVKQTQCPPDYRIAESGKPSAIRGRYGIDVAANGFHKQAFSELGEER